VPKKNRDVMAQGMPALGDGAKEWEPETKNGKEGSSRHTPIVATAEENARKN